MGSISTEQDLSNSSNLSFGELRNLRKHFADDRFLFLAIAILNSSTARLADEYYRSIRSIPPKPNSVIVRVYLKDMRSKGLLVKSTPQNCRKYCDVQEEIRVISEG